MVNEYSDLHPRPGCDSYVIGNLWCLKENGLKISNGFLMERFSSPDMSHLCGLLPAAAHELKRRW